MSTNARRSARAKKLPVEDAYVEDGTNESVEEVDEELPPARKRAKTKTATGEPAAKRAKGVKGKLSKLPDMPLDVLFEVNLI
jgi:hypothetical protein